MAKAVFHRNQRVFVKPVGTWALVERLNPVWVKGVEEPVRITYEVGLGRDFVADELEPEAEAGGQDTITAQVCGGGWRLMRAKNKWKAPEECAGHPVPGTFPVVVTDKRDWGGWRVPGAEYDRDPQRIEFQARLIANAPTLLMLAERLVAEAGDRDYDVPDAIRSLADDARQALRAVREGQNPLETRQVA